MNVILYLDRQYYFNEKKIEIIEQIEIFNLAVVRFINTTIQFIVDINFINTKPSQEKFVSVKILERTSKV